MMPRRTRTWLSGGVTLGIALVAATTAHGQARRPALPAPAANADARVFKVTAELDAASSAQASRLSKLQLVARIVPGPR